jgi:hypothetical protein
MMCSGMVCWQTAFRLEGSYCRVEHQEITACIYSTTTNSAVEATT